MSKKQLVELPPSKEELELYKVFGWETPHYFKPKDWGRYLVAGLIRPGEVTYIMGHPGAGKSMLATGLANCLAGGWEFFGRRVQPCPVLYLAAEDPDGIHARLHALEQVSLQRSLQRPL